MGCASGGLHGSNGTASAPANPPPAAGECLLLFTLVLAGAIVGGGVIIHLLGASISAAQPPRSLAGPKPCTAVAVKGRNEGWSRPLLPDHAELAASEQAQLEEARARRGWRPIRRALTSQFDKGTHRRRTTTKQCPPSIAGADFFVPSRNASDEGQQQQAYIFAIPTVEKMEKDESFTERSTERST